MAVLFLPGSSLHCCRPRHSSYRLRFVAAELLRSADFKNKRLDNKAQEDGESSCRLCCRTQTGERRCLQALFTSRAVRCRSWSRSLLAPESTIQVFPSAVCGSGISFLFENVSLDDYLRPDRLNACWLSCRHIGGLVYRTGDRSCVRCSALEERYDGVTSEVWRHRIDSSNCLATAARRHVPSRGEGHLRKEGYLQEKISLA
mmetsp:Transcript_121783/g.190233  ORF Transcript_121783/g.190233 Transcript_121783/m.190233 type:complete len:202 (+) Transcript_121783:762-1367(+)